MARASDKNLVKPMLRPEESEPRFRSTRRGFLIGAGAGIGLLVGYAAWPGKWPGGWYAGDGEKLINPWIRIAEDGQVTVAVPQAEMGQGVMSGFAQIVADELGADWKKMAASPAPWHPEYANVGLVSQRILPLPALARPLGRKAGREFVRRINLHITGGSSSIRSYHDKLREMAAEARAYLIGAAAKKWSVAVSEIDTNNGYMVYKANRLAFAEAVKLLDLDHEPPQVKPRKQPGPLVGKPLPRIDLPPKVDGSARFAADVRLPGMVFAAVRHGPIGGRLVSVKRSGGPQIVKAANWVAAIGITTYEAERALAAMEIEFEQGDEKPVGPWLAKEFAKAMTDGKAVVDKGDMEAATGTAVSATYQLPYLAHACMEPMTATARVIDGRAEVWGPTQSQTMAYWQVADALGIPKDQVVIYPTLMGGGFGRKLEADCMVEAALVSQAIGKPVQLFWSRSEDFASDRYRPAAVAEFSGKVNGGKLTALEAKVASPSVVANFAARNLPRFARSDKPNKEAIEGVVSFPYTVPAFRAIHTPVVQPAPLGFWRSADHSTSAFFVECFIDELAEAAGADPLKFRLQHLANRPRHLRTLKTVADAAEWEGGKVSPGMALGMAVHEMLGSVVATIVEAGVTDSKIRIGRVWSAIDCGQVINPTSVQQQLEGGTIMGLSAALRERISFVDGAAEQRDFDSYPVMTMADAPLSVTPIIVPSDASFGSVGEPALPPAAPALANALFAATGKRWRSLPLESLNG